MLALIHGQYGTLSGASRGAIYSASASDPKSALVDKERAMGFGIGGQIYTRCMAMNDARERNSAL